MDEQQKQARKFGYKLFLALFVFCALVAALAWWALSSAPGA